MNVFWFICLFALLFHPSSSQTVEDCIKNVNKNVINNPNIDLSPQAEQSVLESCKYQGNHENPAQRDGENDSIYNNHKYDSGQAVFNNYDSFRDSTQSSDSDTSISSPSYYIVQHTKQIIEWLLDASMRDIISFDAQYGYAFLKDTSSNDPIDKPTDINDQSTNNDANNLSFLLKQISFEDKKFIKYLQSLLNGINEGQLWSYSYDFANKQFQFINVKQLLQIYESFCAGFGFGIQIFCKQDTNEPFLIYNSGAGGGGGYNKQYNPTFQYSGGGGIQLNNDSASVVGGTGYEHPDDWNIYDNVQVDTFYDIELPKFEQILKDKEQCDEIIVQSGGGSGGGFTKHGQDSILLGFTYYSLNFVLGSKSDNDIQLNESSDDGTVEHGDIVLSISKTVDDVNKIKSKGYIISTPVQASIIACVISITVIIILRLWCLDSAKKEIHEVCNDESDDELGGNLNNAEEISVVHFSYIEDIESLERNN